jgi:hypothetical protein
MLLIKPFSKVRISSKKGPKQQTWAELNTERFACSQNRISDSNTGCLLVDLNRSFIGLNTDDL